MSSSHMANNTSLSKQGLFILARLVGVSKNYRSVIRACMEDMHQVASKLFFSINNKQTRFESIH